VQNYCGVGLPAGQIKIKFLLRLFSCDSFYVFENHRGNWLYARYDDIANLDRNTLSDYCTCNVLNLVGLWHRLLAAILMALVE
jgi:hypothetical protein